MHVVDIIKETGGIPVIAHPKSIGNDGVVGKHILAGVEGLEIYHPSHTPEQSEKHESMAKAHKLLITGGSVWHGGNNAPEVKHMGCVGLPHDGYSIFDRLGA